MTKRKIQRSLYSGICLLMTAMTIGGSLLTVKSQTKLNRLIANKSASIHQTNKDDLLSHLQFDQDSSKKFYTLTKYFDNSEITKVTIPAKYNGLPVRKIASGAFSNCKSLNEVIIPNSVDSIGDSAFSNCTNLSIVNIPKNVTQLNHNVFYNTALENLLIPSHVTSFAKNAIENNPNATFMLTINFLTCAFTSTGNFILPPQTETQAKDNYLTIQTPNELISWYFHTYPTIKQPFTKNVFTLKSLAGLYCDKNQNIAGLTEQGKLQTKITIPQSIKAIPNFVFTEASDHLKTIVINSDQITLNKYSFFGVPSDTQYYVKNVSTKNALNKIGINDDHIFVTDEEFDIGLDGIIKKVKPKALVNNTVKIPACTNSGIIVRAIGSNAFSNLRNTTKIVFDPESQISKIDLEAFNGLDQTKLNCYVNQNQPALIKMLEDTIQQKEHVIVQDKDNNFEISANGTLLKLNPSGSNLVINKAYGNIEVNSLSPEIFKVNQNIQTIEFSDGFKLKGKIKPNIFSELKQLKTLYTYDNENVDVLTKMTQNQEIGICNKGDNFFVDYQNFEKLVGLTKNGRNQSQLTLPENINWICSNAFSCCSMTLNEITIESNHIKVDPNAFKVGALSGILNKIKFYVNNRAVQNVLKENNIDEKNIFVNNTPAVGTPSKNFPIQKIIIIVSSIILGFIGLELLVGLPLRRWRKMKANRANLNSKNNGALAKMNASVFKRISQTLRSNPKLKSHNKLNEKSARKI